MKIKIMSLLLVVSLIGILFSNVVMAASKEIEVIDYSKLTKQEIEKIEQENMEKYDKLNKRVKATVKYTDAISLLDYDYKEIIFSELLEYEKEYPTKSEDEINEYFLSLCNIYNKQNKGLDNYVKSVKTSSNTVMIASVTSTFYNIVEGMEDLYAEEEDLYDENPSKGFKAIVAGDEAYSYTNYKFGFNGHNEKSDAFRHSAWNIWIIGFTNDYNWAYRWTLAHEIGGDGAGQPWYERAMDDNNNNIGRIYASNAGIGTGSTVTLTRSTTHAAYFSGSLKRIVSSSPVSFTGSSGDFII